MDETRYLRHALIDWFSQDAISETEVIVIGAGAVGNEVLKNLALLGVGKIMIFDFDKIEEHNLTRSVLFRDDDVGRYKSQVAAQRISDLDPNVTAAAFVGDFWDLLKMKALQSADVVFCCVDNFEARIRCDTLCYLAKVDLINAGLDSRNAVIETFPFSSSPSAACYECGLPPSVYTRLSERYSCGSLKKLSYFERKIPTTILTSAAAGYIAVSRGLRLGASEVGRSSIRLFVDTINVTTSRSEITKNPLCPCCGSFGDASVLHVKSQRRIGEIEFPELFEQTIETSEPILVQYQVNGTSTVVFEKASDYDSTFAQSVSEDPDNVTIDIRDQFSFLELVERFPDRDMPCKFAIVRSSDGICVLEFEESMYGKS